MASTVEDIFVQSIAPLLITGVGTIWSILASRQARLEAAESAKEAKKQADLALQAKADANRIAEEAKHALHRAATAQEESNQLAAQQVELARFSLLQPRQIEQFKAMHQHVSNYVRLPSTTTAIAEEWEQWKRVPERCLRRWQKASALIDSEGTIPLAEDVRRDINEFLAQFGGKVELVR